MQEESLQVPWCPIHLHGSMPGCADCELSEAVVLSILQAELEPPPRPSADIKVAWCPLHETPEESCGHCRRQVQELDHILLAGSSAPPRKQLCIHLLSGKELKIPFCACDTASDVTAKLATLLGIPQGSVQLVLQEGLKRLSPTDPVAPHENSLQAFIVQ